jgi:hypothetical protein
MPTGIERALIGILAGIVWTLAMLAGGYAWGDHTATERAELAEAKRTAQAVQAKADADAIVLAQERALRSADAADFANFKQDRANELAEKNRRIACLSSGACRVFIPVRQTCAAHQDAGGPAAAGTAPDGYAELDPKVARDLDDIAYRGDQAIRKHAEVVRRYERLRQACTAPSTPPTTEELTP